MVWDKSSQDWGFCALTFHVRVLKYVQMSLYFTHRLKEKNPITPGLKKINLIKYNGRKMSFKILALKIELTAGATIFKLIFGHLDMSI